MHIDVVNGLLGAGKTTFLLNLLKQKDRKEKVVVLVNEFGEIGIDGDLLSGKGANVVELPNGCICCTLNADLRTQVKTIAEEFNPDRLLLEPTGIATIKNLLGILGSLSLEKYIDSIHVTVIVDASSFNELLRQNRNFVENQLKMAKTIILNKCDLVGVADVKNIKLSLETAYPNAKVFLTTFGKSFDSSLDMTNTFGGFSTIRMEVASEKEEPLKKYEQFSKSVNEIFDLEHLRYFFSSVSLESFGNIDRAKGIFYLQNRKWVRFDYASKTVNEMLLEEDFEVSKIILIGTGLDREAIFKAFESCIVMG